MHVQGRVKVTRVFECCHQEVQSWRFALQTAWTCDANFAGHAIAAAFSQQTRWSRVVTAVTDIYTVTNSRCQCKPCVPSNDPSVLQAQT
jgi:hypothetical protein